jgi:NADPH-dependent 2,4-dienoyl-CoA reductase/sulfur reductase-like enzyme/nitrite reductase/ring-hydroxylating ferredoxin subunit
MADDQSKTPDLALGIALDALADGGKLVGHVGDHEVLLIRSGNEIFAVGALCTHYHAPLIDGLVVGDSVHCPWHHARFDLRTGQAICAPAFDALRRWPVEQRDGKIFVHQRSETASPTPSAKQSGPAPDNIVIVGGGAAAFAAMEMLRREQYQGGIIVLSNEDEAPIDRPNLSKDYLAGSAPDDWMPLRPADFYAENAIDLQLNTRVTSIDPRSREVELEGGKRISYDRLLLATGAEPVSLSIPGAEQPNVRLLRSFADCRAIIERARTARRTIVLGASFIGLEVAAALRARGIEIHVVAPDKRPLERVLGPEMGDFVRSLHEEHGVIFHLEDQATEIKDTLVTLKSGRTLEADFIVAGIGVRPRIELAEQAGLTIDRGVVVDSTLETSAPGIFAAGDIARWPDPYSGEMIRVEHWVVAERQGQIAARNMLGRREKFTAIPFFWSQHYDIPINYVGHAETWDDLVIEGDIAAKDCLLRFKRGGRLLAVASISRDIENLKAELAMEQASA